MTDRDDPRTDLPQPGADVPDDGEQSDPGRETDGPGGVSVDEPTAPALAPDEIADESTG